MDAIRGDQFSGGRRVRPATQEFAVLVFPNIIVAWLQGRLQIDTATSTGSLAIVRLWIPPLRGEPLTIVRPDFEIIKGIALNSTLRMFPSDTIQDAMARITAAVSVAFAGRGVPNDAT
jgi:hypothetical protein